tara:strand:+ start:204 stop:1325 length:1122 start_codon:yes stop_codon:yes gene_type:complete
MSEENESSDVSLKRETFDSIVDLASELERQAGSKLDLVVDPRNLSAEVVTDGDKLDVVVNVPDNGTFPLTDHAHAQVSDKLKIPKRYYDRMRLSKPDLLAENVNEWLQEDTPRLLRILEVFPGDGLKVRAFLSDRYRVLDNHGLLGASLQALKGIKENGVDVDIVRTSLTETNMFIKARSPSLGVDFGERGEVHPGIIISNSEVGSGGVNVSPFFYFLACSNGLISEQKFGKIHLGSKLELGELVSQQTQSLEDAAVWSSINDLISGTFDAKGFDVLMEQLRQTTERDVFNPVEAVNNVVKEFKLPEGHMETLLSEFSTSRDYTQWGLFNAVTAVGKTVGGENHRVEWEKVGGKIAVMDGGQFERLSPLPTGA